MLEVGSGGNRRGISFRRHRGDALFAKRVESSVDTCSRRRTRCTVTQRRTMAHDTHGCSQHRLVLQQTSGS